MLALMKLMLMDTACTLYGDIKPSTLKFAAKIVQMMPNCMEHRHSGDVFSRTALSGPA